MDMAAGPVAVVVTGVVMTGVVVACMVVISMAMPVMAVPPFIGMAGCMPVCVLVRHVRPRH